MFKHVKFANIPVSDQDRAIGFYRDTLGFKLEIDDPYDDTGWRWVEFSLPEGKTRVLFEKAGGTMPPTEVDDAEPALVFIVDDVESVFAELTGKGVHFIQPPTAAAWDANELFALFADSEGNTLMIGARRHPAS